MMNIHKLYKKLVNRRKAAYRELGNPNSSMSYKRMAMKHIDHIDKHLPSIEKATGRRGKSA